MTTIRQYARAFALMLMAAFATISCSAEQSVATQSGSAEISEADFAAWLDGYKEAWETRDAAKAGALFTEDATYQDMPFNDAMNGRAAIEEYWSGVTADQRDVRFTYEVLTCDGDECLARWHAAFSSASSGAAIELDGVFLIAFADGRTAKSLKEWWHVQVTPAEDAE